MGVVDLVANKALIWREETIGANYDVEEIPADLAEQAAEYRDKLLDMAVEQDDDAMEKYLDGEEPDYDTLIKCIRKGTISYAVRTGAVRLGVQEQGRPAHARRRS